jgi:acyl-CoA reductase-like NAD-dependent aldehyde dehydrogenase
MLVRQAYDGAPIDEIPVDDEAGLLEKLDRAASCFADRPGWLPAFRRIEILRRLARLMEREFDALAMLIAREGGKPLIARAETARAINGDDSAIGDMEHFAGREIPMGLTAASENRWAFTTREPIGVVAAISAFVGLLAVADFLVFPQPRCGSASALTIRCGRLRNVS